MALFGDDWLREIRSLYLLGEGKTDEQVLNDIWHALFSFSDEERLRDWAREKLQLTEEQAKTFADIRLPQDYAALSLNAIRKVLVYLRCGYRYDEAVFLANLRAAVPKEVYADEERRHAIAEESPRCCLTTSGIPMTNSTRRSAASPTTSATTGSTPPAWSGFTTPRRSKPTRMRCPMRKAFRNSDRHAPRPSATRWPCGRCSGCAV